mgnify:CR=1 FL=1
MSPIPPPLPTLNRIPYCMTIDALTGYLCAKWGKTNSKLTTLIFAIRSFANAFFYHAINYLNGAKKLESQKIYLATSFVVNMTFLVALRELNLIGDIFSCLIGLAAFGYTIKRAIYIQSVENQAILDGKEIA